MVVDLEEIRIAHSPDSDDAFMFYGFARGLVDTGNLSIVQVQKDIQTLNREALAGLYEVTAISFAAYPLIADKYLLMPSGSSMGDNYGPVLVSGQPLSLEDLSGVKVAIPGGLTTAWLALRMLAPGLEYQELYFEDIPDAVADGKFQAGLLIHEGQLTYASQGLHKIVDLGQWWHEVHGLPLPLGGNAIRRDLGAEKIELITSLIRQSIELSLANREDAIEYAMQFSRDLDETLADRFISMYVNELSVDCGIIGRQAVEKLFEVANSQNLYERQVKPEFVQL